MMDAAPAGDIGRRLAAELDKQRTAHQSASTGEEHD
jgi:hypothetical protein